MQGRAGPHVISGLRC